jgi:hypothetical protein
VCWCNVSDQPGETPIKAMRLVRHRTVMSDQAGKELWFDDWLLIVTTSGVTLATPTTLTRQAAL